MSDVRSVRDAARTRYSKFHSAVKNESRQTWTPENFSLGWQFFDPQSHLFIEEGAWTPVAGNVTPGDDRATSTSRSRFPRKPAPTKFYVSHIQPSAGWAYARGEPFLRILVEAPTEGSDGKLRSPGARDHHRPLAALAAHVGRAAQAVR